MKIVNAEEFNSTIASGVTLVDFYADWCGPCKMIAPVLEELSGVYTNVNFIKLNVDNEPEVAQKYGVMSIPTILMMKDGEVVNKQVGFMAKPQLESFIQSVK